MSTLDAPASQESPDTLLSAPIAGSCLVCSSRYGASRLPGLKRCTECGFITADLTISDAELSALYGEDYFHGTEYRNYVSEEGSLKFNFRRRIETLKTLIPDLHQRRIFEIGCAYGFFLDEVKGEVAAASGIDISVEATQHARNEKQVDAATGSYSEYTPPTDIGVITMWDTIEHLPRPDLFIEKASRDIDPGGYIAITTGDIASLNARFRGKRWRMIHPPTHVHYFSVKTLSKLLDRHGFEVIHVSHPGNARDLRSILHFILDLRLGWSGLYRRLAKWRIFNLSLTLNLFDIMFVVARRREA